MRSQHQVPRAMLEGPSKTLGEWVEGRRAQLPVTRKELLTILNSWGAQAVDPRIAWHIRQYHLQIEAARHANRWWRRLGRWVAGLLKITRLTPEQEALLRQALATPSAPETGRPADDVPPLVDADPGDEQPPEPEEAPQTFGKGHRSSDVA